MTPRNDVTEIVWVPLPSSRGRGRGEATIVHGHEDTVVLRLTRDEARRLARLYFGSITPSKISEVEIRWFPQAPVAPLAKSA